MTDAPYPDGDSIAFCDLAESQFPITVEQWDEDTGELLDRHHLAGPGALRIRRFPDSRVRTVLFTPNGVLVQPPPEPGTEGDPPVYGVFEELAETTAEPPTAEPPTDAPRIFGYHPATNEPIPWGDLATLGEAMQHPARFVALTRIGWGGKAIAVSTVHLVACPRVEHPAMWESMAFALTAHPELDHIPGGARYTSRVDALDGHARSVRGLVRMLVDGGFTAVTHDMHAHGEHLRDHSDRHGRATFLERQNVGTLAERIKADMTAGAGSR